VAHKYADRVKETTSTTGTGDITLAGVASGYQSFNAGIGLATPAHTTDVCVVDGATGAWEIFVGTLTDATTIGRGALISSSTGSRVSFAAGTKDVFCTASASRIGMGGASVTRCVRSANAVITNRTAVLITWDAEERDDDGAHSTSSNTSRITVPAGKSYARLTSFLSFDNTTAMVVWVIKNGAGVITGGPCVAKLVNQQYSGHTGATLDTGIIAVTPGDHFEVWVNRVDGTGTLQGPQPSNASSLAMSYFQAEFW